MYVLKSSERWQTLAAQRAEMTRRLDVYQQAFAAKEAQLAELSVVRSRNLEKVVRKLERQERAPAQRLDALRQARRARALHPRQLRG